MAVLPGVAAARDVPSSGATWANPLDIDYRYNWEQQRDGISYRTGADPVIVRHRDAFYLFLTLADGYWRSTDLVTWRFVTPSRWPFEGMVAPAAWSDGRRLYLMASTVRPEPVLASDDPASGRFDFATRLMPPLPDAVQEGATVPLGGLPPGPWDPALFGDEDGRWYLYWGSSNLYPLYGIELDHAAGFAYRGTPRALIALDPGRHGWERFGPDHRMDEVTPFIEGAWMSKIGKRYYLQYAAPGTEHNVYATGTYVGASPLGPFAYAPWNPVAYKPGGFVTGAGHGSLVEDASGNPWLSGTAWVGANWPFERRVALFPARVFPDGQLAADTRFGDFPHRLPIGHVDDPDQLFTGWMLLSYRKPVNASSTLDPAHPAASADDENPRTFWVAAANRAGETLTVDLGGPRTVRAVQVNFADYRAGRFGDAPDIYTEFEMQASTDGRIWATIARTEPPRRDRPNAYLELDRPVAARFVRYVHGHVGAATLAISDLRVFGTAGPGHPAVPRGLVVRRHIDTRDATVRWRPVAGAVGYNVRWGVRPDRLAQCTQLWADQPTTLELRALTAGQRYFVSVEAFDERGVSRLGRIRPM